jgi:hypothetical protein
MSDDSGEVVKVKDELSKDRAGTIMRLLHEFLPEVRYRTSRLFLLHVHYNFSLACLLYSFCFVNVCHGHWHNSFALVKSAVKPTTRRRCLI